MKSQADKRARPTKKEVRKTRKRNRNRQIKATAQEQEPVRELYRGILPFAGIGKTSSRLPNLFRILPCIV